MKLTQNAVTVLERRYLTKDENGNLLENPDEMMRRVAKTVAAADVEYVSERELEKIERRFYKMLSKLEFLPNSPTLMNAGRPLGQLSACFVLPIEDSMEGIFETIKNAALIHKSGGGTGFSFSRLRSKGSTVNSTGGVASGPVSFMKVFNAATEAIKQGGTRRGANMGILRVDHPDIREFITCKQDNEDITNFNISIAITESFMEAVEKNEPYDLIEPSSGKVVGIESAVEIFEAIIKNAWNNGEPGIVFLDRINRENVTPGLGEIESTNPCGEQPLLPYEACNLGSINLSVMVKLNDENKLEVDYERIKSTVHKAVHFLDNVIEVNKYPLLEIDKMTRGTRKVGLGVMGWADLLCQLGVPYNSEKALKLADQVMGFIQQQSKEASMNLALQKGVFPYYDQSIYKELGVKVRNATTITIAPTGTLSIIAGVSSGVEPIFAISYIRSVMDNDDLVEVNPLFEKIAKERGFYSDDLMRRIAKKGTIEGFDEIPDDVKAVFVCAHDIEPEWHVRMQATFQKHTDNAVSKTVNMPHHATPEDVREVFELAYRTNCKGITIYRDGSRDIQVLNIGKGQQEKLAEKKAQQQEKIIEAQAEAAERTQNKIVPRERPETTMGFTEKVKIGCGNLYITVNYDENGICEVFTNLGRGGGCPSQSEATSRLVSIALRSGIEVEQLVEQLRGIRCPSTIKREGVKVTSCPDAIGRVIEKVMSLTQKEEIRKTANKTQAEPVIKVVEENSANMFVCPECGSVIEHEGGCVICRNCGFSKCG